MLRVLVFLTFLPDFVLPVSWLEWVPGEPCSSESSASSSSTTSPSRGRFALQPF